MMPSLPAWWIQPRLDSGRSACPVTTVIPARLPLGQPHRAHLRVGERHAAHRPVVRPGTVLAQDVADDDGRLVHRHVRERALAGDVTDGPSAPCPQPLVGLQDRGPRDPGPSVSSPTFGQVGPPSRRHQELLDSIVRSARVRVNVPSWSTRVISTPVTTSMPSRWKTSPISCADSGSSGPRMRSRTSTTVTRTPNRAKAWASSAPMAPPPITTRLAGSSVSRITSRLVQYGQPVDRRHGRLGAGVEENAARRDVRRPVDGDPARAVEAAVPADDLDARLLQPGGVGLVVPVVGGLLVDPVRDQPVVGRRVDPPARVVAIGLGERVGRPDDHLEDAAVERALAPDQRRSTPTTRSPASASFWPCVLPPGPSPMTTTSTSMPVSLPQSASARQVSGPREAEQAVAGDARGDRQQQELAERLLQHLVQRHVQAPDLLGSWV